MWRLTETMTTEASLVDAELARQRAADRERQKAHDQKMRGMSCSSYRFCLTGTWQDGCRERRSRKTVHELRCAIWMRVLDEQNIPY